MVYDSQYTGKNRIFIGLAGLAAPEAHVPEGMESPLQVGCEAGSRTHRSVAGWLRACEEGPYNQQVVIIIFLYPEKIGFL